MLITDIFQYPVKGLSEETLTEVELVVDTGMPADRLFAITHGKSRFDHTNPAWVPRKNFAVVAHSPEISPILCRFDQSTLTLTLAHNGETILQETVGSNDMEPNLNAA